MNKEEMIKQIETYETKIKEYESKLVEVKKQLLEEFNDFETWNEYGIKQDYNYLIDKDKAPLIRKYFIDKGYWDKYQTLYLDEILGKLDDDMDCEDDISKEDIEPLKKELMRLNFGSMVYDW